MADLVALRPPLRPQLRRSEPRPGEPAAGEPAVGVARLAEIRAAGLIHNASEQVVESLGVERSLPVAAELRSLFPGGCLRRGTTVSLAGTNRTSLLFALLAEASAAGSWCAAVGLPELGLVAAAEAGVVVDRFALVPQPGPEWPVVVAALLDGVDLVVAAAPAQAVAPTVASRLAARVRQRGSVFVPVGPWPGADITLEVVGGAWHGLGQGRGRLRQRELEVLAHGRGAATRARRAQLLDLAG